MKIRDIMTSPVASCTPDDSAATALERLWTRDCGILPVIEEGRVTGVVTDRDIAMALVLKGRTPRQLVVREVTHGRLHVCEPDDDISVALQIMAEHQVRRLPVVDADELAGIVSMNDLIRAARAHRGAKRRPTYGDVIKALRLTCAPTE